MVLKELIVSIFPEQLTLELFHINKGVKTLSKKSFENFSTPLSDMNKVDTMDIEKIIKNFLGKDGSKSGKVSILVFGDKNIMPYHEFDLGTTSNKEIKVMLPLEIESLGEGYLEYSYKRDVLGSKVKTYFLKKTIVEHLGNIVLPGNWELDLIMPGYLSYMGIIPTDGVLLELSKDKYNLYGFRNGYISSRESGNIFKDFSIDRPVDPTPDYLVSQIEDDVKQYITNFEFEEGIEIEMVTVAVTYDAVDTFTPVESGGIYFSNPKDFNNKLDIEEQGDVFKEDSKERNCNLFDYSDVSYGVTYLGKNRYKYDFSPEKLNYFYKNVLVTSMAFALMSFIALPSASFFIGKQVESSAMELNSYETSIKDYQSAVEQLDLQIETSDSKINDYNDYVSSLSNLNNVDRNFVSNVMEYLPENTPSTILVQDIRLIKESKKLILKGVSDNYKDIGSLAIQLEKFGYVKINQIDKNELMNNTGYPFEIEMSSF